MKRDKPRTKLKTIQFIIKNKHNLIFNHMTTISKNIFNCCVYSNNIFCLFKKDVLLNLYNSLIDKNKSTTDKKNNDTSKSGKIKDNKIKETSKNKGKNKKTNKETTNKETTDKKETTDEIEINYTHLFASIMNKYYILYNQNKNLMNENNKIIYEYIKSKATNIILNSKNIENFIKDTTNELSTKVKFDDTNKNIVFNDIINRIIKSFYNKKYFLMRYQMLNNIPFNKNIIDEQLEEDIKNKNYFYENNTNINLKKEILEKFNIEIKSDQYLFKYFVYNYCLGNNKDKLPADIILNIIDKYSEAINSYYGKLEKKMIANKPKYLKKDDKFNLFYFPSSFLLNKNNVRLTVGSYIANNFKLFKNNLFKVSDRKYCSENKITKNVKIKKDYVKTENGYIHKNELIDGYYLYLKLPKILKNKIIKLIQIKPYGNIYTAYISYETPLNNITKSEPTLENSISIDTGIKNLMTIYNPTGKQHIIKGGKIKAINEFYNKKISELQSINKKENNQNKFNRLYSLLNERKNKLNGEINNLVDLLYKTYESKRYFIIGYNENWKTSINLGTKTNRQFYMIPYLRIIQKLREKLESNGKELIINEESYTSKCDSLCLEYLGKKTEYLGNRKHRGLFISSIGKAINADLNGAINIMRKIIKLEKITGSGLYNPRILEAEAA